MEELRPTDPPGVGPYRFTARLGAGGMGEVYRSATPAGMPVAVKIIRPELAGRPGFRDRFRREVALARRVTGPSTASIVDADPDGPVPYLVTELVPGEDLERRVVRAGPLAGAELVAVADGVARALVATGRAGIVHRDLKPANVLLGPGGPKLIDFGISRAVDDPSATQIGVVRGSPQWMAPEQARGLPVTDRTDVFAWGGLVAYASSGRPPFGSGAPEAVLYRVVHEPPDLRGVEPGLAPLVQAALAKDPVRRPTAAQLVTALASSVGSGTGPRPAVVAAGVHPSALAPPRRRAWAVPISAVVFLLVTMVGAGAVVVAHRADHGARASDKEAGRTRGGVATTHPGPRTVSADLPLVSCPTDDGLGGSEEAPTLPPTVSTSVPSALAGRLAVYTDRDGQDRVVGPAGWGCSATQDVDGSTSVSVYPRDASAPATDGSGDAGDAQAIVFTDSGGCTGCALTTASPLFPAAASACADQFFFGGPCPSAPDAEQRSSVTSTLVEFVDPSGVTGTGVPSGGTYPARGAMVYSSGSEPEAWLQTCTLASSAQAVCATSLSAFVAAQGD